MSKLFGIGNELSSVVQGFSDMLTLKIASLNTFMLFMFLGRCWYLKCVYMRILVCFKQSPLWAKVSLCCFPV